MQNRQKNPGTKLLLTQVFKDFDHFSEAVKGGDLSMTLCALYEPVWRLNAISLEGVETQHGYLGSGNLTEGYSHSGGTLIYVPLSDMHSHQAVNGIEFDSRSCVILRPGTDFDLCIRGRHEWCSVFVPTGDMPGSGSRTDTPKSRDIVRRSINGEPRTLGTAVRNVMSAARLSPGFESSPAGRHAAKFLRDLVGRIAVSPPGRTLPRPVVARGRPRYSTRDIIVRCRNALEEQPRLRMNVSDLVSVSQVSERTLRNAFNTYFGVSPGRYLQIRLIRDVHQDLLKADPDHGSVTGILLRRGVWEFGRFASRYRRIYGEVPSVTLRRHK
jgi:AraC family ethanolamine operon transcriptional activator